MAHCQFTSLTRPMDQSTAPVAIIWLAHADSRLTSQLRELQTLPLRILSSTMAALRQ